MKKFLLSALALVAVVALAITGTIAYLQNEDSDKNVMTLGSVKIAQHEYERDVNEDGTYKTAEIDNRTSYVLRDFTQDKPLYPAIIPNGGTVNGVTWDYDAIPVRMSQVGSHGGASVFNTPNAVDKFVTVENTGKSDAYVRTLIAFEMGELTQERFGEVIATEMRASKDADGKQPWHIVSGEVLAIDGKRYYVFELVYNGAQTSNGWKHEGGVLPAGETTYPSLCQVYMAAEATNEDVEAIDGNGNGTFEIYVMSQAVQVAGFESADDAFKNSGAVSVPTAAKIALDTAFGEPTAKNVAAWVFDAEDAYQTSLIDEWDGTADTSWYDPANPLTEYSITTAEQLAGLAELVSGDTTFAGVTFTLERDMDLYCEDTTPAADGDPLTFRPIGDKSKNGKFEGTFNGNDKTIYNLYQNGWDLGYEWGVYGSYGLFGNLNNATVKNLTLTGGESLIEGGDVSFVAGSATGTCVFENITIEDSIAATYNNGCGGIIGWSGAGNYTFKDITIAEDAVLAGLWGSFDSSIGGIVGQGEPGATYNFENVDIACRIDAYNDCTASYDYYNYRMCGMIIGRLEETTTIDGSNYPDTSKYNITCNDVEVIYGDWVNYHYCRATGERAKRVEAGYSYGGVAADYDHSVCTAHHMELIAFDQIFGGDQYAVKGLKSYDGVNVIYNNK